MDKLNNHIKRIVRDQLRTLCGEEQPFPSSPTRYNRTKFETLADKDMLTEGLIRTYPMEWVEKYLSNRMTSDFVNGGVDYNKMQFWFILKQDSKSIEPLKKKMETFGYFCSVEDNVSEGIYLQFEPKFDIYRKGSEFSSRNNGIVFYHVAPIRFKKKILNVGLVPKAKNKYLKYPDRIYLMLASEGKDNAYDMADMLYTQDENTLNQGKYSLFGVTVDGLDDVKFYPDRNTPHAPSYFTYENIPSKNISFIEDFDAYKF